MSAREVYPVGSVPPATVADVPINLIHMPVPRDRSYFAPLEGLRIDRAARLILGLIHYIDGLKGERRRLQTASKYLRDFSVETECGLGRCDSSTLPKLFDLHVAAASA